MIAGRLRGRERAIIALISLVPASVASAQVMPSERGIVSQTVDGTTITIEYSRPVARGRTPFPDVVRWGRPWTPGANWATTIEVDKPIHLNGNEVPKGKYGIWMIPGADEWTVTLSRDARRFHTQPPSSSDEQTRFTVKPAAGAHMETLAFYFPIVTRDGATLDLHWGTTIVPMRITVEPSRPPTIAASERARYVGTYRLTPSDPDANIPELTLVVTDSAGREVWQWSNGRIFTQSVRNKQLGAGESMRVSESWDKHNALPGHYSVTATLKSSNYPRVSHGAFAIP